jgi:serine phosphatase RsbU (regulator of sigma subunit)
LQNEKHDTTKLLLTIKLCIECNYIGVYDKALDYGNQAIALANALESSSDPKTAKLGKKGESRAYLNMGNIYENQANYAQARLYYDKGLKIKEELHDQKGIADAYNNIGLTYEGQSYYPQALDYFFKSLKIYTDINNRNGMAITNNNIGVIYVDQQNYDQAITYYTKAMAIRDSLGDKMGVAESYDNIATIYESENKNIAAFDYLQKSMKIREQLGFEDKLASSFNNIGNVYMYLIAEADSTKKRFINIYYSKVVPQPTLGDLDLLLLDSAYSLHQRALAIGEKLGDRYNTLIGLIGVGEITQKRGQVKNAMVYFKRASALAKDIDAKKEYYEVLDYISKCHEADGRFDSALYYYKLAAGLKDSVFSEQKQKDIGREEAKYDYEKKQAVAEAENKKQRELADEQRKRQNLELYAAIAGLLMLGFFSFFIAQRLRITRRQKSIIEDQKESLDKAFMQLEDAKLLLEDKHKDLTDSIHYASRIQTALLTTQRYIGEHLQDYFILFKPRDIVSGDFYWALDHNGIFYLACCDCTGHGVPGAFMSLLNITFLHQTVIEKNISQPDKIFGNIRTNVIEALNPDGSTDTKDGMDAVLCAIDFDKNMISAACANNPLWIIRKGELIEFKPDKLPIGESDETKPFTLHETKLQKGDCIYMLTDGYADQFGGPNGKKYKMSQLKELLMSIHTKPMVEQKQLIEDAFVNWKGSLDQVDDVCVMGLRI